MINFRKHFQSSTLTDSFKLGALTLYPINFENRSMPFQFSTFDDLHDRDLVEAREIGTEGIVGRIIIENKSDDYLIIFDGEAIVGAKQNRIAEQTVIILPKSILEIPVNCVERGRWQYRDRRRFSKSNFSASPKMRVSKAEMLKAQRYENVQSEMWNEIDMLSEKVSYSSNTSDLGDVLYNREKYKFDYDKSLIENSSCKGFLVFGTGKPFIEVFLNNEICKKQTLKSLDSWMADIEYGSEVPSNPNVFLEHFLISEWKNDRNIGIENSFSPSILNGRATFLQNEFIHTYYYF